MNYFGKNVNINIFEYRKNQLGITIHNLETGYIININEIINIIQSFDNHFTIDYIEGVENNKICNSIITIFCTINLSNSTIIDPDCNNLYKQNKHNKEINVNIINKYKLLLLTFIGLITQEIIEQKYGIMFISHVNSVKNIIDLIPQQKLNFHNLKHLQDEQIPIYDARAKILIENELKKSIRKNLPIGGSIETLVFNSPKGIGNSFFDQTEAQLAEFLFLIPNLKGIEFGNVIKTNENLIIPYKNISFNNDQIQYDSNIFYGIEQGVTTGDLVSFKTHFIPPLNYTNNSMTIDYVSLESILIRKKEVEIINFYKYIPMIHALCALKYYDLIKMDR